MEFLDREVFNGNTLLDVLISLAFIVGAIIVGKVLYFILRGVIKRLAARTTTQFDNILRDSLGQPIVLAVVLLGVKMGTDRLILPENTDAFLDKVYIVLSVLLVAWALIRLIDALVMEYWVPQLSKDDEGQPNPVVPVVRGIAKLVVWIMAIIMALNNAGYDVLALLTGLGIGGLAVALAAQDTFGNLFGGFTIFTDKPFRLGDEVILEPGVLEGRVEFIGVRSTRLRNPNGRIVTVPNSKITQGPVENVSSESSRRLLQYLSMSYETTPEEMERALTILKEIVRDNPALQENVTAIFNNYRDYDIRIQFVCHIKAGENYGNVTHTVNMEILRRFQEAGLKFAYPTQRIFVKQIEASQPPQPD